MTDFSLKHDPLSGFEGLGSIPLPKLPLSAPTPHPRVWRSWEHTSTQTSLQCPHPCPTSTGHFPSLGPEQGGYCSVFVIATTYYAGVQRNLYIMKSQGSDKICSLYQGLVILRSFSLNFALTRVKNTVLVNRGLLYKGSTAVPVH